MASRRLSAGLMPLVVLLSLLLNDPTQPVHICRHASQYAFLLHCKMRGILQGASYRGSLQRRLLLVTHNLFCASVCSSPTCINGGASPQSTPTGPQILTSIAPEKGPNKDIGEIRNFVAL